MTAELVNRVADIVLAIEAEMRQVGIWQMTPPSDKALASQEPFCVDTLEFNEWLQWVFLSRMKMILEQGAPLPERSAIYPYAEEWHRQHQWGNARLLNALRNFDEAIAIHGKRQDANASSVH